MHPKFPSPCRNQNTPMLCLNNLKMQFFEVIYNHNTALQLLKNG